ncbi:MAG: aminoacyl-tRNA hydrolase [Devosia sp.]|uniref:alternative ribosome rescue aminoacyl-tRNA hydrolase ArfB n=1 Tax=Devosia sp. 66-22 TaxID=1895753 RepID=UPI000AA3EA60|nr:alternative ribosome rescue aminoacyl-tRNA hydrolase ArfB [Devosia sp. 66-22]MBN9345688.1 aminoacyl-tRNA hydrolase [Devosia sp.]
MPSGTARNARRARVLPPHRLAWTSEDSAIARLPITPSISIDASELTVSFIRASGPGGQNVNKVASAVQLRFDLANSPSLSPAVKARAARLAGAKLTTEGEVVITADRHRTQGLNRDDAVARLAELLAAAAVPPKPRRATRPTLASKQRRLERKTQRGGVKKLRTARPDME